MDNRHIHCMTFGGFLVISEVCLLPGALTQQHTAYFPSDTVKWVCSNTSRSLSLTHTHTPLRFLLCVAWDPGPAGYEFVRQSVYSLWRWTVGGGGLALLLNPLNVIVLSHVRVMETMGVVPIETLSRTQYSMAHMPYTPLSHSLTTGANAGHRTARLPQEPHKACCGYSSFSGSQFQEQKNGWNTHKIYGSEWSGVMTPVLGSVAIYFRVSSG